jgi:hypothetical protein
MRYKLTEGTQNRLRDLLNLIRETRPCLAVASPSVRDEWDRIRGRFPSDDDVRQGYTSLSELELEEMRSKIQRFRAEARPSAVDDLAQLVPVSGAGWQPSSMAS